MRLKYIRENKVSLLHLLVPLLIGSFLYWLMCPDVYFVRVIDTYFPIRRSISMPSDLLTVIIRNHLFDALWAYSLYYTLILILDSRRLTTVTALIFLVSMELLQETNWCPGTFDTVDVGVEILSVIVASVTAKIYLEERSNEESKA